jgi:hypothetical protein
MKTEEKKETNGEIFWAIFYFGRFVNIVFVILIGLTFLFSKFAAHNSFESIIIVCLMIFPLFLLPFLLLISWGVYKFEIHRKKLLSISVLLTVCYLAIFNAYFFLDVLPEYVSPF